MKICFQNMSSILIMLKSINLLQMCGSTSNMARVGKICIFLKFKTSTLMNDRMNATFSHHGPYLPTILKPTSWLKPKSQFSLQQM